MKISVVRQGPSVFASCSSLHPSEQWLCLHASVREVRPCHTRTHARKTQNESLCLIVYWKIFVSAGVRKSPVTVIQ